MSEMVEVYKALKEHDKERRQRNLKAADPEGWTIRTPYHWQRRINGELVDYWPSRNKWHHKGKRYHGDVKAWLRKAERQIG